MPSATSPAKPNSRSLTHYKKYTKFELRVSAELIQRGWTELFHDVEVLGVQVDLLMRNPKGLLAIVEVKTQSRGHLAHISWAQRRRLFRVSALLSGYEPVELQLALVEGAKITLLPVDALTAR